MVVALCQKKFDAPNYLKLGMIWWKETLLALLTLTVHELHCLTVDTHDTGNQLSSFSVFKFVIYSCHV